MKRKRFAVAGMTRFTNARHVHFHMQTYEMIGQYGFDKVNVPLTLSDEWKRCIVLETELNNQARAHVDTARLIQIDAERDSLTTFLFGAIRNATSSPFDTHKAAGEELMIIIRPYKNLQRQARDRQTAQTEGLVLDLKKPENAACITILGLDNTVELLEKSNRRYQEMKSGLTSQKAAEMIEGLSSIRPQTDDIYQAVTDRVFASYLLTADAQRKEEIGALIDRINQFIAEQKAAYKQSQAQKTKGEE